ncbi:MAG: hypothetical protein E7551_03915 [Ruminococcaceae bacterium]|nr:hypothetical protein [Oscillospiraceae bacterium]
MKIFKKIISAVLIGCMLFTLCACHGKDEVALTIEGEEIKSALYLNALVDCDSEAKQRVDEEIAASETESESTEETEETDYYSKTLDGLSFVDYVKEKTLERCKEFAFYRKLVDEGTIKLDDEEKNNATYYAQLYWYQYGYAYLYEANGVSFDTYNEAFLYSYYSNAYFKHLYGEGGEKEVPAKDIKDNLLENYTLAHVLTITYEDEATDDQKAAHKTKLEGYEKRLKAGETFEKIYTEHNGNSEEDHQHAEGEDAPKIQHATVLADKNSETQVATPSADFDAVYDMKVGETAIIENEDKTSITLYVKLDISSDEYYLKQLTDEILYNLKNEEFQKYVTEKTKDYKIEENTFATNRFDVEDIDYSVLEQAYATQQQQ